MRQRYLGLFILLFCGNLFYAQLPIARDTLSVIENGYTLKMPWANGINFSNVSNIDLNNDNIKDLVLFDRVNQFGTGRFRCFINTGGVGQTKYKADLDASYLFPQTANWAVLKDYNCDGKEDLFCSTSAGIKVYKNTSTANGLNFTLIKSLLYTDYGGTNGKSNLYASTIGVPGIEDIDNDGDLDILSFAPQGIFVEYHKNMSKELYGHCDSLVFNVMDVCWGKISESQCQVSLAQCNGAKGIISDASGSKEYHAGSCLTCIDGDGDNDQDLIMGDIACNTVHYVLNGGTPQTALFIDTTAMYPNFPAKNNTTQLKINNFPCAYYVDVDGDNKKDLVATPNAFGSENSRSVWYYKNASATNTVNFQFVKTNLLQDEMIEVGQNAFPVTIDYDADGKKDLLIGTFGYYQNNSLSARLTLYKNISTTAVPVYSLITRDYANLSAQNLNNVMPTVGDIDNDGDVDICVGNSSGQIHWLENTAGANNPCNFSVFKNNPFTFTTSSAVAAPQLFDLDGDNKLDLLIGGKNGRIAYYRNVGTASVPAFSLITNYLGNVDVKGSPFLFGLDGYAAPFFYRENTIIKCLIGSVSGNIWHFQVGSNINSPFTLLSNAANGLDEGAQSTVLFEDLDGDNKRDLMIGNGSGGLTYFSSSSPYVGIKENSFLEVNSRIAIFPNPVSDQMYYHVNNLNTAPQTARIIDVTGRTLKSVLLDHSPSLIDVSDIPEGFYFVEFVFENEQSKCTKVFVKGN